MTTAILVVIGVMWLPVALLFLGYGEPKGTGAATSFVGIIVVIGAIIQSSYFKDPLTGGLLLAHAVFYLSVSYALLTGLEDMRSIGNVAFTVAIISSIYAIIFFNGSSLVPKSNYLGLACLGYVVLTLEVWLNAYGKFPAKGLAWSLIAWTVVGLWIPAYNLMVFGKLPF